MDSALRRFRILVTNWPQVALSPPPLMCPEQYLQCQTTVAGGVVSCWLPRRGKIVITFMKSQSFISSDSGVVVIEMACCKSNARIPSLETSSFRFGTSPELDNVGLLSTPSEEDAQSLSCALS